MTPHQIQLVKASFTHVFPIRERAAELFYARLFELDPNLRPLFKGDLVEQGAKLMSALSFAVWAIDDVEQLYPKIDALGRRHHDYGVREAHYDTVGQALLWTLEKGLGDGFTRSVFLAWAAAYDILSKRMIAASAPVCA